MTAAVIYLPEAQDLLGTRPLRISELAVLAVFPVVVWAADELFRAVGRRRRSTPASRLTDVVGTSGAMDEGHRRGVTIGPAAAPRTGTPSR